MYLREWRNENGLRRSSSVFVLRLEEIDTSEAEEPPRVDMVDEFASFRKIWISCGGGCELSRLATLQGNGGVLAVFQGRERGWVAGCSMSPTFELHDRYCLFLNTPSYGR